MKLSTNESRASTFLDQWEWTTLQWGPPDGVEEGRALCSQCVRQWRHGRDQFWSSPPPPNSQYLQDLLPAIIQQQPTVSGQLQQRNYMGNILSGLVCHRKKSPNDWWKVILYNKRLKCSPSEQNFISDLNSFQNEFSHSNSEKQTVRRIKNSTINWSHGQIFYYFAK